MHARARAVAAMNLKVALLAAGMLLTGTINTIAVKYQVGGAAAMHM